MRYALLCLALAGCATELVHPTKSQEALAMDRYECRRDAAQAGMGGLQYFAMSAECLEAKGWRAK